MHNLLTWDPEVNFDSWYQWPPMPSLSPLFSVEKKNEKTVSLCLVTEIIMCLEIGTNMWKSRLEAPINSKSDFSAKISQIYLCILHRTLSGAERKLLKTIVPKTQYTTSAVLKKARDKLLQKTRLRHLMIAMEQKSVF